LRILGIDSATWIGSVAVDDGGSIVEEQSLEAERSHAESLPLLVGDLLRETGIQLTAGDAIAVSSGPGSFTGLRIGFSLAKGLAFAVGAAVVAVPTLDALAVAALPWEGRLCCCLDARKQEVYAALYARRNGNVVKLTPDLAVPPLELARRIDSRCTFVGDAVEVYGELFTSTMGGRAMLLEFKDFHPRASVICRLARKKLECQGEDDLANSEPQYVRAAEAEIKLQKKGAGPGLDPWDAVVDNEKVVYYEDRQARQ